MRLGIIAAMIAIVVAGGVWVTCTAQDRAQPEKRTLSTAQPSPRSQSMPAPGHFPRQPMHPGQPRNGGGGWDGQGPGYSAMNPDMMNPDMQDPDAANPVAPMMHMLGAMKTICFDPDLAAVLAISAIKEELKDKPADAVKTLETLLGKTRSPGIRNAIRLTLKDLYKAQKDDQKLLDMLQDMVIENDKNTGRRIPMQPND